MRLLLLMSRLDYLDDSEALICNAFRRVGWEVVFGEVNAIAAEDYRCFTRGVLLSASGEPSEPGSAAPGNREVYFLDECQLIWVMNPPQDYAARDIWQMLWLASRRTAFVNSIEGMTFLNTKHALGYIVPKENRAFSYTSSDFSFLWDHYRHASDKLWVAKPANAACGQNVFLLTPGGRNVRVILQCITGNADMKSLIFNDKPEITDYAILQKFIPEVEQGEKRVVVTCGEVVAWYGREGNQDDHRSNIVQGGTPKSIDLHSGEVKLAEAIGRKLVKHGVNFIGIDMAYPYIVEVNIGYANGLYNSMVTSGIDRSDRVAELIIAEFEKNFSS
ncbi:RimK family alpha-L-glutamate ligase [Mesorhizobium sp. Cs1299R1N1]|uniref:RimK family alpha-L-glutamate ligase n=1 Tax=Mesorhizobium sp. Cs1299R1N1 TaxID=3015172 RepID=UPI00301D6FEE